MLIARGQVLVFSTVVQAMVPTNQKPVPSIDTRVIPYALLIESLPFRS